VSESASVEAESRPKVLVFIIGPPAVGKMTVGQELSDLTGLPLFHNHLSIEAVLPVFGFGTAPFQRLVTGFRKQLFTEVAESDLPGLIFTYVWAFDDPGDLTYVQSLTSIFESGGGRAVFAELQADLETRLARNQSKDRMAAKRSKRDLVKSRERLLDSEKKYRLQSDGDFPYSEHLVIDNSRLSPRAVALRIARHFGLPTKPGEPSS
jgi:hypothetical protein